MEEEYVVDMVYDDDWEDDEVEPSWRQKVKWMAAGGVGATLWIWPIISRALGKVF